MTRYVALLRGINVGGNNLIPMPALKRCFEDLGYSNVLTYIQSGNVLFSTRGAGKPAVPAIEVRLSKTFNYTASVVLRSDRQLNQIVAAAPDGFGTLPDRYRYDVIYLKEPLSSREALRSVTAREGVDQVWAGRGVLYFSRLIEKASQSQLNRLVSQPVYQRMTIRNWNTTTRLLALLTD
jgi:uncharacterized protein (DUF1697 family)